MLWPSAVAGGEASGTAQRRPQTKVRKKKPRHGGRGGKASALSSRETPAQGGKAGWHEQVVPRREVYQPAYYRQLGISHGPQKSNDALPLTRQPPFGGQ